MELFVVRRVLWGTVERAWVTAAFALGIGACSDAGVLQLDSSASASGSGTGGVAASTSSTAEAGASGTATETGGGQPTDSPCWAIGSASAVFHVATDGSDAAGDGSLAAPWATIAFAVSQVPDGALVEVAPGDYAGPNDLVGSFAAGIHVRATPPYLARLRNDDTVVTLERVAGLTLEGFDIAHSGSRRWPLRRARARRNRRARRR